jgi:hypothetical protein
VFVNNKDGTRVPMLITHKNGIALDGNNPTLLKVFRMPWPRRPLESQERVVWRLHPSLSTS